MQIHGSPENPEPVNPYYAATEKAIAAQRPFNVRKKPAKRAAGAQTGTGSDQTFMIGQWMNGGRSQVLTEDRHHAGACGKEPDLG
jgi:hypothetical protein